MHSFNKIVRLWVMGVAILLTGCMEKTVFHSCLSVAGEEWYRKDTLCFCIDSLPAGLPLNLQIEIRTLKAYPYRNLCVIVEQQWDKQEIKKDTVNIPLNKEGKEIYLTPAFSDSIPLIRDKKGTIRLYHFMRRETLPGISDIGILITR